MAKKISKRVQALQKKVDFERLYNLEAATAILKKVKTAKFDETVEIALRLDVDPRHADQMIRGAVVLPYGTGKKIRVAVFAKGEKIDEAKAVGADIVGTDDLVADIKAGKIDFDIVIATPDCMGAVGQIGRILGPKGLMPNPKTGTVTTDIAKAVQNVKSGQVNFRVDKKGNIHAGIGKVSFDAKKLEENAVEFLKAINRAKPSSAKGKYILNAALSLTMSHSLKLDTQGIMDIK